MRIWQRGTDKCLYCFSESRNYEKVAMTLCSFILFPQAITIELSDEERTIEWFIILNACTKFLKIRLSEMHFPALWDANFLFSQSKSNENEIGQKQLLDIVMKVVKNMVLSVKWLCLVSKLTSCRFCRILHSQLWIDTFLL